MDNDKIQKNELEQLRIARARRFLALPGFIVIGLICALGGGLYAGFFIGVMVIGLGFLVTGIKLLTINRKIYSIESNITSSKRPNMSLFVKNIPVTICFTVPMSLFLLFFFNGIMKYSTWKIFLTEILFSAAISFGITWLISRDS